jgi:hypothetical protein
MKKINNNMFSFLKAQTKLTQNSEGNTLKIREAFNNITNTLNKSPSFNQNDSAKKMIENCVPKVLSFDNKK